MTALACAAAWAAIVWTTHVYIGIVASFIGVAVGKVVLRTSGQRRGLALQWLAAVLAALGVAAGKLGLVCWQIADVLAKNGVAVDARQILRTLVRIIQKEPADIFGGFDLLWIGFAVFAAWRLCKAPPITIAGPYPYQPTTGGGLQFHTMEPATPAAPTSGTV